MNTATLLVLLLAFCVFVKTRYSKAAAFALFLFFALNLSSMLYIYPRRSNIERYNIEEIKVGDVISVHKCNEDTVGWISLRLFYSLMTGDSFFHTVLVVDYNGEKYVMNAYGYPLETSRRKSSYKDKLVPLIQKGSWVVFLEPLESFIEACSQEVAIIRVLPTNKHIDVSESILRDIESNSDTLLHCCYFVAKYLEGKQIVSNKTVLPNGILYSPSYLYGELCSGNTKYYST
jgi:hypothetical protein